MAVVRKPRLNKKAPRAKKGSSNKGLLASLLAATSNRTVLRIATGLVVALVVIFIGIFWYFKVYADPERIFWGMINHNLATPSVSKEIKQDNGSTSNDVLTQLVFRPTVEIRELQIFSDTSKNPSQGVKKTVKEAIGTSTEDYQRYSQVLRTTNNTKVDYSSIYNTWAKVGQKQGGGQLVNAQLFGPILFGNLPPAERQKMLNNLKSAYKVNFGSVKNKKLNGRKTFEYKFSLSLQDYARVAHNYAVLLGLPVADQINPDSYPANSKVDIVASVDVTSRQLRQLSYNNQVEDYSSYDLLPNIELPAKTVSPDEFQKRINAVQ